jgi:transposase
MKKKTVYIGIDVSKPNLDVSDFDPKPSRIKNTNAGIAGLIRRIKSLSAEAIVCCEATGGYEQLLCSMLMAEGIKVALANPARVRHFAKSKGILAKTDKIDAEVIAEFSRQNSPRLLCERPKWLDELKALLVRREELINMKKQERSRLEHAGCRTVTMEIKRHISLLSRRIVTLERAMDDLVGKHAELKWKYSRLTEVKSLGKISALSLISFLPELGSISGNQAAALAGVAPFNKDSGNHKGLRMIQGGRSRIRRTLYMAAVIGSFSNPFFKEIYQRLTGKGKPAKVAITAVMRKMIVLANRLLADPDFQLS